MRVQGIERKKMDFDEPLDFESEDKALQTLAPTKRRKKVIGLDDLLTAHFKENKVLDVKLKQAKARKTNDSDDDEDQKVAKLSECVEKCQQKMGQMSGDDEIDMWGLQVFGYQKPRPELVFQEVENCGLLQSFVDNKVNSLVELEIERGELFLERLLEDGWLLQLVYTYSHVERSIAMWTFGLMLYSSNSVLSMAACEFWIAILSTKHKIKIDWFPEYSELKQALEIYGFLSDLKPQLSTDTEMVDLDSDVVGPPQNIRAWIKYVTACLQVRETYPVISSPEAEELLVIIISFFLDRQLLGLSVLLYECMLSVINSFKDDEWSASYDKVAKSIAQRVPADVNCLRALESISGVDARSKNLRGAVAYHILVACLDNKATDGEEIMRLLMSNNNVKEKSCNLSKLYLTLVLAENWVLWNSTVEEKPEIREIWGVYLRNLSCQITSTDLRSYASKIRSKASYLLQGANTQ